MNAKTLGDLYDVTTESELGKLMADGVTRIDLLEEGMHTAGLRAVQTASKVEALREAFAFIDTNGCQDACSGWLSERLSDLQKAGA